jgi:S1-C subfamily serine protease
MIKSTRRPRRRISPLALALLAGGVLVSLLIVISSVGFLFWLWKTDYFAGLWKTESAAAQTSDEFSQSDPVPEGADALAELADAEKGLESPPRPVGDLEFESPLPKSLTVTEPSLAPANVELPREVVQRVKQATVYIQVRLADGGVAQGSGFFGVEPNVVLTNAHVLGMLHPGTAAPRSIDVTTNGGTKEEKKYSARLLGIDRNSDLAVLRVAGSGTPAPLEVRSARNLRETQRVWVLGFPFGAGLGKEITVSDSSVSSLRREKDLIVRIQVNGGMHPGNSGGPVVDAGGNVVGVAVSVIRNSQINFAVPGDYVQLICSGRVAGCTLGTATLVDGKVSIPVTMGMIDPLERVRQPALIVWTSDARAGSRPATLDAPAALTGDSPHVLQALQYRDEVARGAINVLPLSAGKAYWLQPTWINRSGERLWACARAYQPETAPVEPRPILLAYQSPTEGRSCTLKSWLVLHLPESDGEHRMDAVTALRFLETAATPADGLFKLHLQYQDYRTSVRRDNQRGLNPHIAQLRRDLMTLSSEMLVDRHGNIVEQNLDTSQVSQSSRQGITELYQQISELLRDIAIPLPNREVKPGESWSAERHLPIRMQEPQSASARIEMSYRYLGVHRHDGRDEAAIELHGRLAGGQGSQDRLSGRATGSAIVDVGSGQVLQVDARYDFTIGMPQYGRGMVRSQGTLIVRLQRLPGVAAGTVLVQ